MIVCPLCRCKLYPSYAWSGSLLSWAEESSRRKCPRLRPSAHCHHHNLHREATEKGCDFPKGRGTHRRNPSKCCRSEPGLAKDQLVAPIHPSDKRQVSGLVPLSSPSRGWNTRTGSSPVLDNKLSYPMTAGQSITGTPIPHSWEKHKGPGQRP